MVWGFIPVMFGVLCQVASIAEASSLVPLAGAQYVRHSNDATNVRVTHAEAIFHCLALVLALRSPVKYGSPSQGRLKWRLTTAPVRKFVTWIQGWSTTFSWIALLASISNVSANAIVSVAAANNPGFDIKNWQIVLVMLACLVGIGLLNLYLFQAIPWIECVAGLLHVILWITFIVVLLTLADRHSTHFVFFQGSTLSGWDSAAAFNIGNQASSWCFVSFDFISHISEVRLRSRSPLTIKTLTSSKSQETKKPTKAVPRAMFWSIVTNAFMAFVMVIVFLYTVGDVERVASSRYPLMDICIQATNSIGGATAMVCGILIILLSGQIGALASVSRLTWAW